MIPPRGFRAAISAFILAAVGCGQPDSGEWQRVVSPDGKVDAVIGWISDADEGGLGGYPSAKIAVVEHGAQVDFSHPTAAEFLNVGESSSDVEARWKDSNDLVVVANGYSAVEAHPTVQLKDGSTICIQYPKN